MAGLVEASSLTGASGAPVKLDVWHNILWSGYKASVFTALGRIADERNVDLTVYQIAETEGNRVGLGAVDLSLHRYPMVNLFKGRYDEVPLGKRLWALARGAWTTDADMVVLAGYERPEYILQALILWLRRKPRAVFCDSTQHDNPRVWWKVLIKRLMFGLCGFVFCYGERARAYVIGLGVRPENAIARCQAAALPPRYDAGAVPKARVAGAGQDEAPLYLYVGRLSPEKRLDVMIHAFAKVRETYPAARLRLVGSGPQGDELKALAFELGLGDKVEFPGGQSKDVLFANYEAATCLILPSWTEPWGLVVNEALHLGCPVIVSHRCGCVPELVADSDCGAVVECGNVADLADKMTLATTVWADRRAVALACLKRIAPFTPHNAASAIMGGVERVVARMRSREA